MSEENKTSGQKKPFFARFNKKLAHFTSIQDAYGKRPRLWVINIVFIVVLLFVIILMNLNLGIAGELNQRKDMATVSNIIHGFLNPNWNYFFGIGSDASGWPYSFGSSVIYQVIQTFGIAFIGTVFAAVLAVPFGFLASRKIIGKWAVVSEVFLIFIRTFPELLLGLILVSFSGFSPITGVFALGIHSIGMIGKLYSEQLDMISPEPLEALDACGASSLSRIKLGVMPQVWPNFISVALYRFDINIRTATILGVVCGDQCGIGHYISSYSVNFHWPELGAALIGVIVLVAIVDIISSELRKKLI